MKGSVHMHVGTAKECSKYIFHMHFVFLFLIKLSLKYFFLLFSCRDVGTKASYIAQNAKDELVRLISSLETNVHVDSSPCLHYMYIVVE